MLAATVSAAQLGGHTRPTIHNQLRPLFLRLAIGGSSLRARKAQGVRAHSEG